MTNQSEFNRVNDFFKNDFFHSATNKKFMFLFSIRNRSLQFNILKRTSKLINTITFEITNRQNVRYFNMFQYLQANVAQNQIQNQTILDDNEKKNDLNLNQNFVNSNKKKETSLRQTTFSIRNILSLFSIKQKFKIKRFKNRKITINVIDKNNEAYRCVLKNNTREFVKKFSFVTKKNFFKLMKKNERKLFEIFKHLLIVYQKLNKAAKNLQLKMNMISTEKTRLKNRINAQKLKINDFFKKRQKSLNRENELTRLLKVKKMKLINYVDLAMHTKRISKKLMSKSNR